MRDLNSDLIKMPFDQELKSLAFEFASLLKAMVETIDHFGLKNRFLKRHKTPVARFYRELSKRAYEAIRRSSTKIVSSESVRGCSSFLTMTCSVEQQQCRATQSSPS